MSVSVCNCVCVVLAVAALVCLPDCATALFFGRPSAKRPADVLRLTELAQASGRGTISANNQEIIRTVDKLRLQASESSSNGRGNSSSKKSGWNVDYALLDGTWDLLWTTEKVRISNTFPLFEQLLLVCHCFCDTDL